MTFHSTSTGNVPGRRVGRLTLIASLVAALFATNVPAQAPAAPGAAAAVPSPQDLETLVGKIALYPDDLVAIILPASTNPLQMVQADRFLDKRKADPKTPVDEKWDEAVKSLLNYPEIVKMMSNDLDWTSALGEAVVADSGEVMAAVQAYRRKVNAAGNLKTDDKQKVIVEQEIIKIEPANPEVIYVPQYNPTTVVVSGGYYGWGYYPSPYPVYYYPYAPGAAFAAGIVWGAAMGAIWGGGRYGCGWGGNDININRNTNINVGSGNTNIGGGGRGQGGGSTSWKSNKQPGQVSSSVGKSSPSSRAGDARGGGAGAGARPSTGQAGGGRDLGGGAGGAGASTRDVGGGAGGGGRDLGGGASAGTRDVGGSGRQASPSASTRSSGSAFDGGGSGRQAGMDSSRGASSRSSMSSGGGARAGGGGGARGGGGGGRGGGRR
jgi:Protein of unknown function (DUF3300)